jgi:hypothetical protein
MGPLGGFDAEQSGLVPSPKHMDTFLEQRRHRGAQHLQVFQKHRLAVPRIGKERPATGPLLCIRRLGLETRQKAVRRLAPLAAKVVVLSPQQLEQERPSKLPHRVGGEIAAGQPQQSVKDLI